ncbi:MAG: H-NS histone family protein [Pseudomonadota bacterium]
MELSNLSVGDLRKLQENIAKEIVKRQQFEISKAREEILAIARSVGLPLKDLIGKSGPIKTGSVAVQFRHPEQSAHQWTGRGRQPNWVKEWVSSGKSMDQLRVSA